MKSAWRYAAAFGTAASMCVVGTSLAWFPAPQDNPPPGGGGECDDCCGENDGWLTEGNEYELFKGQLTAGTYYTGGPNPVLNGDCNALDFCSDSQMQHCEIAPGQASFSLESSEESTNTVTVGGGGAPCGDGYGPVGEDRHRRRDQHQLHLASLQADDEADRRRRRAFP